MLKYPKPKILLVDMPQGSSAYLRSAGFASSEGTFGAGYKVEDKKSHIVLDNSNLPNLQEQEVIIVNARPPEVLRTPIGTEVYWDKDPLLCDADEKMAISPRGASILRAGMAFERILKHGGCFIIFAAEPIAYHYALLQSGRYPHPFSSDSYGFLRALSGTQFREDRGDEIEVEEDRLDLHRILRDHMERAEFSCTLVGDYRLAEHWIPLARNKYRDIVAAAISPDGSQERNGWIFIFPQLSDQAAFVLKFLREVLPGIAPRLFPYFEGNRWVDSADYEMPRVTTMKEEIHFIQEDAERQVAAVRETIEAELAATKYLIDLITGTDQRLVDAVKTSLHALGFVNVVEGDKALDPSNKAAFRKEDLQVHDRSPMLLVEVKGVAGGIRDASALQVTKYIAPRMREWSRTDLKGLAVINHQRHIPPLERTNDETLFRNDLLLNASQHDFGLLTAWDLYRLVRNFVKHGWKPEHVMPLFYQSGRIWPVPTHYKLVGVVEHFWENVQVVGVRLTQDELPEGSRIAFAFPIEYEEQVACRIQVEHAEVKLAAKGDLVGIKTLLPRRNLRKGVSVYRVFQE